MRFTTHSCLFLQSSMLISLLLFALPLSAHLDDPGYRLLELDGHRVKWGDGRMGTSARISYAFSREDLRFNGEPNCSDLAPIDQLVGETLSIETLKQEAAAAFRVWEHAAGLSFHEVREARDADIILGAQGQPVGRAFANVSYTPDSQDGVRAIKRAVVCLNPDRQWKVGFDGNEDVYDIRYTLVHEIGHAIGLDHPGPAGQVMGFHYTEDFDGLQAGDLRGVQLLYGPADHERALLNSGTDLAIQGIKSE